MKKVLGILGLLIAVCVLTGMAAPSFLGEANIENLLRRSALFGLISIGAAFVIVTGGIDLSIGSVICLVGCLTPWLIVEHGMDPAAALPLVIVAAALVGLSHGLLVTKLSLQPFVVTLCGLLLYRGITRGITNDMQVGFQGGYTELRSLATGSVGVPGMATFELPMPCLVLAAVAVVSAVFLHHTVPGRYLLALGRNEEAARLSGIRTDRMTILAYVICSMLAGLGGLLFVFDVGSAQASSFGNFYELYAIAGAVLGGCALRGGEATILGVVIGASVMQVLRNSITLVDAIPKQLEYAIIGAVLLAGASVDELVKRWAARRRS